MAPKKDESRQVLIVALDETGQPAYIEGKRVPGTDRVQLNVNAVIVPGPTGLADYYSDNTINAIPVPPAVLMLNLIDPGIGAFTSQGVIIENQSAANIWFSFDNIQYHRILPGRSVTMDEKGATVVYLLGAAGGEAYEVHAWG